MSKYSSYDSPTRPDPNCRSCTDFKTWSRKQREISQTATKTAVDVQQKKEYHQSARRSDCPLDKDSLGNYSWGLLHTIAAVYPDQPTDSEQRDVRVFFDTLSRLYPCDFCSKAFRLDLSKNPVKSGSQNELSQWLCNFHNRVNKELGKPTFDCSKVNERWRDGWVDGSCD